MSAGFLSQYPIKSQVAAYLENVPLTALTNRPVRADAKLFLANTYPERPAPEVMYPNCQTNVYNTGGGVHSGNAIARIGWCWQHVEGPDAPAFGAYVRGDAPYESFGTVVNQMRTFRHPGLRYNCPGVDSFASLPARSGVR